MTYPWILTNSSVTIIVEGKPVTVQKEDSNYKEVKEAIINSNWDLVKRLADKETQVAEFAKDESIRLYLSEPELRGIRDLLIKLSI